jgi:hypothetical protein
MRTRRGGETMPAMHEAPPTVELASRPSGGHCKRAQNVSGGAVGMVAMHTGAIRGAERVGARRRGRIEAETSGGGPDASLRGARHDEGVDESRGTVNLAVTLVEGSDPVRGSVRLGDGRSREFWGWLELAEIVQEVAEGGREATEPGSSEGEPSAR